MIREVKNEDPNDLALKAKVKASGAANGSKPENVISGVARDLPGEWKNRWAADLSANGAQLELNWKKAQILSHIQITFDTGFERQLTLTASDHHNSKIIRAPQPETVKAYEIHAREKKNKWITLVTVEDNYQRMRRHSFPTIRARAIRIIVKATNGSKQAIIYEVRCYS
jgi:hypothetical protein